MPPLPITDPDDPRIEPYRGVRDRDLRGRGGRVMLEGAVVLGAALKAGRLPLESVLLHRRHLEGALPDLIPAGVPVYAAEGPVLDAIAGFPLHRGILAVGLRGPEPEAAALLDTLPRQATVLVLAGLANHDNVGGCFRNAAAFGVDAVLLDAASCDPLYRKSLRVSAGAAASVPFARGGTAAQLCATLGAHGFELLATSPRGREPLEAVRAGARVAVLLGAEGPGLPADVLDRLRSVRIAMAAGCDSLNVATAGAVVLHHLRTAGGRVEPE